MKRIRLSSLILFLFLACINSKANAAANNYGLKPIYGANQIAKNGQLDIFGDPGSQQIITLGILNQDQKAHRYTARFYTAYTSGSGNYAYYRQRKIDPSLRLNLRHYVQPKQKTVKVAANQLQNVSFQVQIPKSSINGYLMGGIVVTPAKGEAISRTVSQNGILLKNQFRQGIPVKIRQDKNLNRQPEFRVRQIVPTVNRAMKVRGVKANLQNYVAGFNGDIAAVATVTKRPDKHQFKKVSRQTHLSPAPNSNYNYQIDWGDSPLQAGDYHLNLKLRSADQTRSWVINKNFTINNSQAKKYNQLSGIEPNYLWLWLSIALLTLLLVLGIGIYFGRRSQQKIQQQFLKEQKNKN
ncbi:DUF3324 domain-containing protein [Bombilactobacillus apium]|nr:DUF3324 domain-containing protein [Bombilactobacillus apium]